MFTLGQRIRSKRMQQKIAIEELAEIVGVTRQTVANWEADRSTPTVMNFTQLCNIFCVRMEYFVGSDSEMKEAEEIAATKAETERIVKAVLAYQRQRTYMILAVIFSILFAIAVLVVSAMGIMVFSDARSGADYVTTVPIGLSEFIVACIAALLFAAGASIFYMLYFRSKRNVK